LRLEGLVLQVLELDLHPGMRGVVVVGDLIPDRLLGGVLAHMEDGDGLVGGERRDRQPGPAGGRDGEMTKTHGLLPLGIACPGDCSFSPRYKLNLSRLPGSVKPLLVRPKGNMSDRG